jgi:hypothetical protein
MQMFLRFFLCELLDSVGLLTIGAVFPGRRLRAGTLRPLMSLQVVDQEMRTVELAQGPCCQQALRERRAAQELSPAARGLPFFRRRLGGLASVTTVGAEVRRHARLEKRNCRLNRPVLRTRRDRHRGHAGTPHCFERATVRGTVEAVGRAVKARRELRGIVELAEERTKVARPEAFRQRDNGAVRSRTPPVDALQSRSVRSAGRSASPAVVRQ